MKTNSAFINFLSTHHGLDKEEETFISNAFAQRHFNEKAILVAPNTICDKLFFIEKGILRIGSTNDKGIDITHWFFKENQLCTVFDSFANQQTSIAFIQASTDVDVCVITKQDLLQLYRQVPWLENTINQVLQQHMVNKVNTRNTYVGMPALDMYKLFLEQQADIAMRVSQKDIAAYLGITQQSLSRLRATLHSNK